VEEEIYPVEDTYTPLDPAQEKAEREFNLAKEGILSGVDTAVKNNDRKRKREWRDLDIHRRIQYKTQRLVLLSHASKCDGTCKVTRHCAEMKRLWQQVLVYRKKDGPGHSL